MITRVIAVVVLLALAGFGVFGFMATFEPLEGSTHLVWRVFYGVGILASLAGAVFLVVYSKVPGDAAQRAAGVGEPPGPRERPEQADVIIDPALAARLAAIGPYTEETEEGSRTYRWRRPAALAGTPLPFDLDWVMEADESPIAPGPDERMAALWDRYWPRHAEHAARFIAQIGAKYRGSVWQDQRRRIPATLPDEQVVRLVESAAIIVTKVAYEDETGYDLKASFGVPWEQDHVYWFCYHEETGEFDDLEKC